MTPVMQQFWNAKKEHPDSIMLFRMGDFYETFDEDAIITSKILSIALTKRANGGAASVPLAGFPYHSLEQHLHKLLKAGHRVAICEQVEDPKISQGIVKREVVEVLSPGTALSDNYLDQKENNYLCAVILEKNNCGFAILDYSTGEFKTCSIPQVDLLKTLKKFHVSEVIIMEEQEEDFYSIIKGEAIFTTKVPEWCCTIDSSYDTLTSFFNVSTLKGFGIEKDSLAIMAAGCALFYVDKNFKGRIKHITSISLLSNHGVMGLDEYTIKNLELFRSLSNQGIHGTLIETIDKTVTPLGSRLLKNWLRQPLMDSSVIHKRLGRITELINNNNILESIQEHLKKISDIERILARVSSGKFFPRDIVDLGVSLFQIPRIKGSLNNNCKELYALTKQFVDTENVASIILETIKSDPPSNIRKGGFIKDGFSSDLDELRSLSADASQWMLNMQIEEQKNTQIPSLKVGYNKIFGYYIEITKTHLEKVPNHYIRKQTLTNSERYFTEELKLYEEKILSAQEKIVSLEYSILENLQNKIISFADSIQQNAKILASIDIAAGLANLAIINNYNMPLIDTSNYIEIKNGRHPVVENLLPLGEDFIPNDLKLDHENVQIAIITGPNMAGKSTYLRQIGLIVILAQIGSYVPADSARIGMIDKLFTRVGASDNLAGGESTFLVEMNETANILNNATANSLILLDEIGRGTSTYDGLSIAWAVTEYIHNHKDVQAKTLFATHYHELVSLAEQLPKAINLNVAVKEFGDKIAFLKKIIPGGADKSYGVYVAEMAGLPRAVIYRAKELLNQYSKGETGKLTEASLEIKQQMNLFTKKEKALQNALSDININKMTPLEALEVLDQLKKNHGI